MWCSVEQDILDVLCVGHAELHAVLRNLSPLALAATDVRTSCATATCFCPYYSWMTDSVTVCGGASRARAHSLPHTFRAWG